MDPKNYTMYLKDVFYGDKGKDLSKTLVITKKSNNQEYTLDTINKEQKNNSHMRFGGGSEVPHKQKSMQTFESDSHWLRWN